MLKELFIDKLTIELKEKIRKKLKDNKDEKEQIINILNKKNITINDIILLLDNKGAETNYRDEFLLEILKNNSININVRYLIYIYLINTKNNNLINYTMNKLDYPYNINDINDIDKYLKYKKYNNNELALNQIKLIFNHEKNKSSSEFKNEITKLEEFRNLVINNLLPVDLIEAYTKITKTKNNYLQLIKVEKIIKDTSNNKKNMLLIYLTYNYKIDSNLEEVFQKINITKEDITTFIKYLEEKEIILTEKRLENLLKNFKHRYYHQNNLETEYKQLSNKVISEYTKYYSEHFYFSNATFVKYYNELYQDDFSIFTFDNKKTPLTEEILYSLFKQDSLLSNYFLFKENFSTLKTCKKLELETVKFKRDQLKTQIERKKFYKKYKCRINEFINTPNICYEYFIIKNIPEKAKGEFNELFRIVRKDDYKKLKSRKVTTKDKAELLKKDFILELSQSSYKERYNIIEKYKKYAIEIKCNTQIKDNFYDLVVTELERQYYLLLVKDILYRLESSHDILMLKKQYQKVEEYVKKELSMTLDELFNKLAKKHNSLKERYLSIQSKLNINTNKKIKVINSVK